MKRTRKQNRPEPVKRSQRKTERRQRETFHPGRKEHADQFIKALEDPKSRQYAVNFFQYIWTGKSRAPKRPRGLRAGRVAEIDAALYGIFATLR